MTYLGDFAEDATVRRWFNTVGADGSPITIGGTAAAQVYKSGSATPITVGVTITEDYDSNTGMHLLVVDMSADAAYTTGADYVAFISVGTADGVSIVGGCLAQWSCENRRINAIKDGAIDVDTFAADTLLGEADIPAAVWGAARASYADADTFGEMLNNLVVDVVKKFGVPLTVTGTPTTTSIDVESAESLTNTQIDNALLLHLNTGRYTRITDITGTTITVSPALPSAPVAGQSLVVFGKYLASL